MVGKLLLLCLMAALLLPMLWLISYGVGKLLWSLGWGSGWALGYGGRGVGRLAHALARLKRKASGQPREFGGFRVVDEYPPRPGG